MLHVAGSISAALPSAGSILSGYLGEANSVALNVDGTWSATLKVYVAPTLNGPWQPVEVINNSNQAVQASITGNGSYTVLGTGGSQCVAVQAFAYVSGTASVVFTGSQQAQILATTNATLPTLDSVPAPTANVSMNSHKITNVLDCTGAQDAATKNYVDTKTLDTFTAPAADVSMNSYKVTGVANPTLAADALNVQSSQANLGKYCALAGTDTYTGTLSPAITAYTDGMVLFFGAANANTGPATVNLNGLGAKAIKKGVSSALGAGDIGAGSRGMMIYDGTNFQLVKMS